MTPLRLAALAGAAAAAALLALHATLTGGPLRYVEHWAYELTRVLLAGGLVFVVVWVAARSAARAGEAKALVWGPPVAGLALALLYAEIVSGLYWSGVPPLIDAAANTGGYDAWLAAAHAEAGGGAAAAAAYAGSAAERSVYLALLVVLMLAACGAGRRATDALLHRVAPAAPAFARLALFGAFWIAAAMVVIGLAFLSGHSLSTAWWLAGAPGYDMQTAYPRTEAEMILPLEAAVAGLSDSGIGWRDVAARLATDAILPAAAVLLLAALPRILSWIVWLPAALIRLALRRRRAP